MSSWGPGLYGDPCRECGFDWTIPVADAVEVIRRLPAVYAGALQEASGAERHRDLAWSVGSYVCHVGDNLRIWAERLAGAAAAGSFTVATYDQDALAAARRYDQIPLGASLWSLDRAVDDWLVAVDRAGRANTLLDHPERGLLGVVDVARSNAHDGFHHGWDIRRSLHTADP